MRTQLRPGPTNYGARLLKDSATELNAIRIY